MPAPKDRIYKRKDGRYEGRYTVHTPDGPVRKRVYGRKYKEVQRKLAEAMGDAVRGIVFDDENMTVSEYMERWLEDSAKGDLGHRAYHNYRLQIRRHISPSLGRIKLSKLTATHVQSLYAAKLRDGLKPSSVRYIYAVLHRETEQARIFLAAARGDRFEALDVLSLTVGLRMGEALGLRWSDIDFDAKTLRVSRQLQRVRDGGGLVFSEPKNASRRTVDLPQRAVEAFRSHRKRQMGEQLRSGSEWQDYGLVFASGKGTPLDAQNIVNRHFKPLLKRAGLPSIRWHDLRHTYATLLLARGTHPTYVQKS